MTGHGQASIENPLLNANIEIRTVNNRFLKVVMNSDLSADLQSNIEDTIRKRVARGTVSLRIKLTRPVDVSKYRLNTSAISAFRKQLEELGFGKELSINALLTLPGVVDEAEDNLDNEAAWAVIQVALSSALENLEVMRRQEGQSMERSLLENLRQLDHCLDQIDLKAPKIVEAYSNRLTDRINQLLQKFDVHVQPSDVIREIGIFAERSDMSEELVRLRSHLDLFRTTMISKESNGRKLDFVVQEILREANTVGSKCVDSDVARVVVEMKTIIERMREMVQNIE